jgi:hypothetical protein
MTDLQKFDPATLMQGVRDRIKATFVSLIPDVQWEQLVQKEIDDFFRPGFNRKETNGSTFQDVCIQELTVMAREKLSELLMEHAPAIFVSVLSSLMSQVVYQMQNQRY